MFTACVLHVTADFCCFGHTDNVHPTHHFLHQAYDQVVETTATQHTNEIQACTMKYKLAHASLVQQNTTTTPYNYMISVYSTLHLNQPGNRTHQQ